MKFVIACLFLIAPLAAHGQLVKCIGPGGKVEYARNCPPGSKEVNTGIRSQPSGPSPSSTAAPKPKSIAEQEAEFRKRQAEQSEAQAKQEKEAALKAQQERACREARNYLAGLEGGARITRIDPKTGERVFLEDAARAQEVIRARQSVSANCK